MARESARHPDMSSLARVAVFAALAFGVNAPFLAIPNVETFSLAIFLAGLFLGKTSGVATAAIAGVIFIFFNPNGPQPVLLVGLAQLFGFLLFGFAGGVLRPLILQKGNAIRSILILIPAGALLTLWYDLSTNLVFAAIFGPFWPVLIGGISFSLIHLAGNTVMFGLAGAIVFKIWRRIEYIMPPLAG
jgi:hypothetical protein